MSPTRGPLYTAIALIVLLLLAVAGCGEGDEEPTEGTPATAETGSSDASRIDLRSDGGAGVPDACSLLDGGEVETFAGEPMAEPQLQRMRAPLYQEVCTYGPKAPGSYSLLQVSIIDQSRFDSAFAASGFTARSVWEQTRAIYPNARVLPGVGDGAFRHGDTVEVISGPYAVGVSVARNDGTGRTPVATDTLVHLARVVVARLGGAGE